MRSRAGEPVSHKWVMTPKAAVLESCVSNADELSGDMGAWAVTHDSDPDEADEEQDAPAFVCPYFPEGALRVCIRPGEFEEQVERAHLNRINGRDMPNEWKGLETL